MIETAPTIRAEHHNTADVHFILDDYNSRIKTDGIVPAIRQTNASKAMGNASKIITASRIRRLTPLECERLQGFPDNFTKYGLSSIMEVCVKLKGAIERQLQPSVIALSTIKDGSVMELQSYPQGLKSDVCIVVDQPLLVNYVIDTINPGKDMVMLCNQKRILSNAEEIKQNLILGKTEGKSTSKLLNLNLVGNWKEEKLYTILTLIRETILNPTSMFLRAEKNIIGVIIRLNKSGQSYSSVELLGLRMAGISQISDTQRYKCLGNAVTVNVIEAIGRQLLSSLKFNPVG